MGQALHSPARGLAAPDWNVGRSSTRTEIKSCAAEDEGISN